MQGAAAFELAGAAGAQAPSQVFEAELEPDSTNEEFAPRWEIVRMTESREGTGSVKPFRHENDALSRTHRR
jgi:hypothetical protein